MINKALHLLFLYTFASPLLMGCGTNEAEIPAGPIGEAPAVEEPDARHIYLWEEGNMPTITEYTVNNGNYQDAPDFRPNIVWYPVPEGTAVKGAVMVCPGGAFMFRSGNEGPFYRQFNQNVEAVRQTGVLVESHVLEGWPHGFGVRGEWATWFDNFLTEVMTNGASDATNSNKGIRTYLSSHS